MQIIVGRRKGSWNPRQELNQARHQAKVRAGIKMGLKQSILEERFLEELEGSGRKIRLQGVKEYGFSYSTASSIQVGQGPGHSQIGQILAQVRGIAVEGGIGAGEQLGREWFETEIELNDLEDVFLEEIMLPSGPEQVSCQGNDKLAFDGFRSAGAASQLDRKATFLARTKRIILSGGKAENNFTEDDLRYRMWYLQEKEKQTVILLAIMDNSESMGDGKKQMARLFFFWLLRILRRGYQDVHTIFIVHDVEAKEVSEEHFFARGGSGGTKFSSAYRLAWEIVTHIPSVEARQVFVLHVSDGDNLPGDKVECYYWLNRLLAQCCLFGYGEIVLSTHQGRTMMEEFKNIAHSSFVGVTLRDKGDLYPALKSILQRSLL